MKTAVVLACAVFAFGQPERRPQPTALPQDGTVREKERLLGERLAANIESQATLVEDALILGYLNRLAGSLSAHCPTEFPITIRAIVSEQMNAFALPGGFIFVNTGLIRESDSEAELAGVVAHLLAHLQTGGLTRQATATPLVNYGSVPLIFMGGWYGYAYRPGAAAAIPRAFVEANRAAVAKADDGGLRCLSQAGYDAAAFIHNLRKHQAAETGMGETGRQPSTHPPAAERIDKAQALVDGFAPRPEFVVSTREFNEIKQRVEWVPGRKHRPPSLYR